MLTVDMGNGVRILIETDAPGPDGQVNAMERTGRVLEKAVDSTVRDSEDAFDRAVTAMTAIGRKLAEAIRALGDTPADSFEVAFGLKFSAGGDIYVVRAQAEAQLSTKIVWKVSAPPPSTKDPKSQRSSA
jgi:hypothetical protein